MLRVVTPAGIQGPGIGPAGTPYGFKISWDSQTSGRSFAEAVYAYTAPSLSR